MGKRFNTINGTDFMHMISTAGDNLNRNAGRVNALNVFPVPDGDTGTNMNMTLSSGVEEVGKRPNRHLGKAADAFSKGLLMGARGNSGVILSQLFRGFAKHVLNLEEAGPQQFAAAFQSGVDTAYKAVVKPVEGTILSVSREAARSAVAAARRGADCAEIMKAIVENGQAALNRTPDQLPVLKQVGVVDAGGQGLLFIYEGFLAALQGRIVSPPEAADDPGSPDIAGGKESPAAAAGRVHPSRPVQALLDAGGIEHGYCTEFMIRRPAPGKQPGRFHEASFRKEIAQFGDSLLVVADDDLVKIHIHAEHPGDVLNYAMQFGELTRIKIENMREQHSHIAEYGAAPFPPAAAQREVRETKDEPQAPLSGHGVVAIAAGQGISEIFTSLGADVVLSGGQTMNPSTEDIVKAVRRVQARTVFVLPNNSNIVMAAEQAKELVDDRELVIIPAKTIPQGIAAMVAFQRDASVQANEAAMNRSLGGVRSGQITYAVRDTEIDGISVRKGEYIGIMDNTIIVSRADRMEACKELLSAMIQTGEEVVTIYRGEDSAEEEADELEQYLIGKYPGLELEVHLGGQPVYAYLFSVE